MKGTIFLKEGMEHLPNHSIFKNMAKFHNKPPNTPKMQEEKRTRERYPPPAILPAVSRPPSLRQTGTARCCGRASPSQTPTQAGKSTDTVTAPHSLPFKFTFPWLTLTLEQPPTTSHHNFQGLFSNTCPLLWTFWFPVNFACWPGASNRCSLTLSRPTGAQGGPFYGGRLCGGPGGGSCMKDLGWNLPWFWNLIRNIL